MSSRPPAERFGAPWVCCSVLLAAVFALVFPSTPTTSSVPDAPPQPPAAAEIQMLEELSAWVAGGSTAQRGEFHLFAGAEVGEAIRDRAQSFELFRSYSTVEERRQLLDGLPYGDVIWRAADDYRIDSLLLAAVVDAESSFDASVVSPRGAVGLMQLMPATAADFGVEAVTEPAANVRVGARYLQSLIERYEGDLTLALAAYNAGPGTVARFGGVPPFRETDRYIERVLSTYVDLHRTIWRDGDVAALLSG